MAQTRSDARHVLPFAEADGYISKLRYRHGPGQQFEEFDRTPVSVVVPVDDLRSIPMHEIALVLDESRLPPIYKKHIDKLRLVVLTRDVVLKHEQVLYQSPLNQLPDNFTLDSAKLKVTSCRTDLSLEIAICATENLVNQPHWPKRRGSRLTTWELNIANETKGPRFPWVRKTADDFTKQGFPPTSSYLVNLTAEPTQLLLDEDAPIGDLLEVWVHEDLWSVLQQPDVHPAIVALQRNFVCQTAMHLLDLFREPMNKGTEIKENSVCDQLISHLAQRAKVDKAKIVDALKKKGAADLAPYVTATFNVNKSMSAILEQ